MTLTLFCAGTAFAQDHEPIDVDFDAIESRVSDDSYYNSLKNRFIAWDGSMAFEEIADLYYGDIYRTKAEPRTVRSQVALQEMLATGKYKEAWEECKRLFDGEYPVSLRIMNQMFIASAVYEEMAYTDYENLVNRYWDILRVIDLSGEATIENPLKAIAFDDVVQYLRVAMELYDEEIGYEYLPDEGLYEMAVMSGEYAGWVVYFDVRSMYVPSGNESDLLDELPGILMGI